MDETIICSLCYADIIVGTIFRLPKAIVCEDCLSLLRHAKEEWVDNTASYNAWRKSVGLEPLSSKASSVLAGEEKE